MKSLIRERSTYRIERKGKSNKSLEQIKLISRKIERLNTSLFMVTSLPKCHTTKTALDIGMCLAMRQKKVLIVDANLANPSLHRWLFAENEDGLNQLFTSTIDTAIHSTRMDGLDVLLAGKSIVSPIDLLLSDHFVSKLEQWKEKYDFVIINSPPLLAGPEADMLAEICEGAILLVKHRKDRVTDIERAKYILDQASCTVMGAIYCKK